MNENLYKKIIYKCIIGLSLLSPMYLSAYACQDEGNSLIINEIKIKKSDLRYGYENLNCRNIREVFNGYSRANCSDKLPIHEEVSKDIIIKKGVICKLEKNLSHFTISVDINNTVFDGQDGSDEPYYNSLRDKFYYLYTFSKDGKYIPSEPMKKITIYNNSPEKRLDLNKILADVSWIDAKNLNIPENDNKVFSLRDAINIKVKKEFEDFIKISRTGTNINIDFESIDYKFTISRADISNPTEIKKITFDNKEYDINQEYEIDFLADYRKFYNLDEHKKGRIVGNICIKSVSFDSADDGSSVKEFDIKLGYCSVKKANIELVFDAHKDLFDEHDLNISCHGKSIQLDNIKYIGKSIKLDAVLSDDSHFTFNKDNKNKRVRKKKLTLDEQQGKLELYSTSKDVRILFLCQASELDSNGETFSGKIDTYNIDTDLNLSLPNGETVPCGKVKNISMDKNEDINRFIESIEGKNIKECKRGKRKGEISALCTEESDIKLLLAYVPFSKSQFLGKIDDDDPIVHIKKIEKFLYDIRNNPNIASRYGDMYIKSTQKSASSFRGKSKYFKNRPAPDTKYNNIQSSITDYSYTLYNAPGDIALLHFSRLRKQEIRNLYCDNSPFPKKTIIFNFRNKISLGISCPNVKLFNIYNNKKVSASELSKKLRQAKEEVINFLIEEKK